MTLFSLPFRQIHLDYHTSEQIAQVGSHFDPEQFAQMLERAHVNSINCFARCHHGWMYYDTQRFPERRHPTLQRNLLKEQIEACHTRGIRVPIYVTVQWDHYTAVHHPEWLARSQDGRTISGFGASLGQYDAGFYRSLCVNSPYLDFLKAHVEELFELLPVDGLWFDIVKSLNDSSLWTQQGMLVAGLDPADPRQRVTYGREVISRFKRDMTAFIRQFSSTCTIFYNEGHISPLVRPSADAYTHYEIESLPSGQWGYGHFPLVARYARTLGKPWLGMTGKFHTEWGDFHSLKNAAALQFECLQMLAFAGACCIGDQLHPTGEMDTVTYDLIGAVYADVERKEAWCVDAVPQVEIGVFVSDTFIDVRTPPAVLGAMRMLQECGFQFNVIDEESDLTAYKVLILADDLPVSAILAQKLTDFIATGGGLIASHQATLDTERGIFTLSTLGVDYEGPAPYSPNFIIPRGPLGTDLPATEHVMYLAGTQVSAHADAKVLAENIEPYFNRTWQHFISHKHTPSSGHVGAPAVVKCGRVIYFSHPIFTQYSDNAPRWCKLLVRNALHMLLPEPLLTHNGPSTVIATVNAQAKQQRWIVHVLHYLPLRRSEHMEVIEDVIPLYALKMRVRTPQPVKQVILVPQCTPIPFQIEADTLVFELETIQGHQMVALEFS